MSRRIPPAIPAFRSFSAFFMAFYCLAQTPSAQASIDLHNHAFMKQGMQYGFSGDFDEPLKTTSYKDRLKSAVNREALEPSERHSGLKLIVVSLYAHPILGKMDLKQSVRDQLTRVNQWIKQSEALSSPWKLARSSQEARQILEAKGRAVVLALEGADGILDTPEDRLEFIEKGGIRIVTLLHLIDDRYGGVAFLRGYRALATPIAFAREFIKGGFFKKIPINQAGLTDKGKALARTLIQQGVWIDYAHASDASSRDLHLISTELGQPILNTHTALRTYMGAERGISQEHLQWIKESGGIVGLVPSEEFLEGTPASSPQCSNGVTRYLAQWLEVASTVGFDRVFVGSDFNGGIPHLAPDCSENAAPWEKLQKHFPDGMFRVDQLHALFSLIAATSPQSQAGLNTFLDAWLRAEKATRR